MSQHTEKDMDLFYKSVRAIRNSGVECYADLMELSREEITDFSVALITASRITRESRMDVLPKPKGAKL